MSWQSSIHARFLVPLSVITITQLNCAAQTPAHFDRVVQVEETEGSVVLKTATGRPMPAPSIQYLPGADGKTILVADFEGVQYAQPTYIVHPPPPTGSRPASGIQEIRIGQFMSSPPTLRVSISTYYPRTFQSISFQARSGNLSVRWGPQKQTARAPLREVAKPRPSLPPLAPQIATAEAAPHRTAQKEELRAVPAAPLKETVRNRPEKTARENSRPQSPSPSPSLMTAAQREVFAGQPSGSSPKKASEISTRGGAAPLPDTLPSQSRAETAPPVKTVNSSQPPPRGSPEREMHLVPTAPQLAIARQFKIDSVDPRLKPETQTAGQEKKKVSDEIKPPTSLPVSQPALAVPAPGTITISIPDESKGSARVAIAASRKLSYRTLKLHNPERFVIDFDDLPELLEANLPEPSDRSAIKSLRVGTPEDKENVHRLVLDLAADDLEVIEQPGATGSTLVLNVRPPSQAIARAHVLAGKTVVVDAGHGGSDPGAQRSGIQEKELTLAISQALRKRLEDLGARVLMTRTDDTFVSLDDRVKLTNSSTADLFISVHINALESSTSIYGIETYYQTEQSKPLAEKIHEQLVGLLQVPDRSVRKARFYVINHTQVPAVLCEVGYISNSDEREKLISSDYQTKIGEALTEGVILYLFNRQELANKEGRASPGL